MHSIPFIDVRAGGFNQVAHAFPGRAKELISASRRTFGLVSDIAFQLLLPSGDRLARDWLIRTKNPYYDEIRHTAETLRVPGVHAFNLCFEWGCTSAVYSLAGGPTLTRVLDWPFPKLGESIIVVQQTSLAGDFINVTWPGISGMFQGVAPGRFSASLNQAPVQRHRLTYAGDWIKNRRKVFRSEGLPPAHLLRRTFEQANDYEQAKELLSHTPVALPVIYILAGIRDREGCVIERTEHDHAIRPIANDRVCAANHFESKLSGVGHGWRPRPIDSSGRFRAAGALPIGTIGDRFEWFRSPIANAHTRLVMRACAQDGRLSVFGTHGERRVTEISHFGQSAIA